MVNKYKKQGGNRKIDLLNLLNEEDKNYIKLQIL